MVNKTRHLGLTIKRFTTRRNIIVAALVAACLLSAAIVSVWFALQNNQYRKDFTTYTQNIQQTLTASQQKFKTLHQDSDTTGTSKALVQLADDLGKQAASMPAPPALFGVRFGTQSEIDKQQAIEQRVKTYALSLKDAAAYIEYQQKAVAPLGDLALKNADGAKQITQLADAWRQASDAHKQLAAPAIATEQHNALQQKMSEIQTLIAQMGDLYAKTDISGFTAKQKDLQAAVDALKPIGEQFAGYAKQFDASLVANLQALQEVLR